MYKNEADTIRHMICGYKFCGDWHCPLMTEDGCSQIRATSQQLANAVRVGCFSNRGFAERVKSRYPRIYIKYVCGVKYG